MNLNFDKNGQLDISIRGTLTIKKGVFTFTPDKGTQPTKPRRARRKRAASTTKKSAHPAVPNTPADKTLNKLYPTLTLHSTLGGKEVEVDFGDVIKISPGVWGNSVLTIYDQRTDKTTKRSVVEPLEVLRTKLSDFAEDWPELRLSSREVAR